jgi:hypothetical protein
MEKELDGSSSALLAPWLGGKLLNRKVVGRVVSIIALYAADPDGLHS